MRIRYTCRGSPGTTEDWKNIKPGTKVIIYEGWNIDSHRELYYGKVGTVIDNRSNDELKSFKFIFTLDYGEGLPKSSIYPMNWSGIDREVRGIILK